MQATQDRVEPKVQALSWLVSQLRWEETLGELRDGPLRRRAPRRSPGRLRPDPRTGVDCGPPLRSTVRSAPTPVGAASRPAGRSGRRRHYMFARRIRRRIAGARGTPALAAGVRRAALAFSVLPTPHADSLAHLLTMRERVRLREGLTQVRDASGRRADRGAARAGPPGPQRRRLADPFGAQPARLPVPLRRRPSARARGGRVRPAGRAAADDGGGRAVPSHDATRARAVGSAREPDPGAGDAAGAGGAARRDGADAHPRPRGDGPRSPARPRSPPRAPRLILRHDDSSKDSPRRSIAAENPGLSVLCRPGRRGRGRRQADGRR